jgi:hypothetical protein
LTLGLAWTFFFTVSDNILTKWKILVFYKLKVDIYKLVFWQIEIDK